MGFQKIISDKLPWRWLVFVFCLVTVGYAGVRYSYAEAEKTYGIVEKADWGATNVWLRSADCARETGAWLAICDGSKLLPIASVAAADDPGHALLLALIVRIVDRPMSVLDVARLNIQINFVGMMTLAALLFAARWYVASFVILMGGAVTYFSWVNVSPHPSLIGAATMAVIFPAAAILSRSGHLVGFGRFLFLVLGPVLLGLASLIREPIGTIGFLITVGTLFWLASFKGTKYCRWMLLVLLGVAVIGWQSPRWVLMARDKAFSVPPASTTQTHGTSHALYLGLGAAGDNKFGIHWDDKDGSAAVEKVSKNIGYVTEQYYQILWQAYLERVAQDPLEVARIYAIKAREILKHRLPDWAPQLYVVLFGVGALLIVGQRRSLWKVTNFEGGASMAVLSLAFIFMFIVQGVLAHPSKQYAHPIAGFVLLNFAIGTELFVRLAYQKDMLQKRN